MNNQNLIPLNQRTKEVQRAIQSAGGKSSAKKRIKVKKIAEIIDALRRCSDLDPVEQGLIQSMLDMVHPKTKPQDRVKIVEFIRDTIGEKPTSKTELSGKDGEEIIVVIKDLAQN